MIAALIEELGKSTPIYERVSFYIVSMAALVGAVYVLHRKVLKPAWAGTKKLTKLFTDVESALPMLVAISDEFTPNGGNSLRDVVDRIEGNISINTQRIRHHASAVGKGAWESTGDGSYVWVSANLCELVDQHPHALMGWGWVRALCPLSRDDVRKEWESAVADAREFSMDYCFLSSEGTHYNVTALGLPLKGPEKEVLGYVGLITRAEKGAHISGDAEKFLNEEE